MVAADRGTAETMPQLADQLDAEIAAIAAGRVEAARATTAADREAAELKIAAAQERQRKLEARIGAERLSSPAYRGPATTPELRGRDTPARACSCQQGDPLCTCL